MQPRGRSRGLGWTMVTTSFVIGMVMVFGSTAVEAFDFYAPFLPRHVAVNETITQVELRLYLGPDELGSQVRVTPVSDSIDFLPTEVVFSANTPVAQSVVMVGRVEGLADISFMAQVERVVDDAVVVEKSATQVATEQINVLPPPLAYAIDDPLWHGVILLNDSFEDAAFSESTSALWGKIRHGYPSSACGAFDGSKSLYFTALGDRFAMTKPLSLLGFDGKIHFRQSYGDRFGQEYDSTGDNRVSCEHVDAGEEIVLSYLLPDHDENNASAWLQLGELSIPVKNATSTESFTAYSIPLPISAMHSSARFRWQQKTHSSFPVDPVANLTLAALLSAANDDTSVDGGLGITERELWRYRNLFDQWALDDVRLEVRLMPPTFQELPGDAKSTLISVDTVVGAVNISVGYAQVVVDSPVLNTWTEYTVGDGTHAFPSCNPANAVHANTAETARLNSTGYVHAIACLDVYNDSSAIVSSFPIRSKRILVRARRPQLFTTVDSNTSVDTWTVQFECDGCAFMRYSTLSTPLFTTADSTPSSDDVARVAPSCSFGTLVDSSSGSVLVNSNNIVFVVACGSGLLPSEVVQTDALIVAPRAPTFDYTHTLTTITNQFNLTIIPPADSGLGVAFTVGELNARDPVCPSPDLVVLGPATVRVHASDVVRAVSCCVNANCIDSKVATWGPILVQAVAPVYSMECSHVKPLTMVLQVTPVTVDAWIQYQVGTPSKALDCVPTETAPFLFSGKIEVATNSTSVFAVSCLRGLQPSDQVEIPVSLEACCSGLSSFQYPSCKHVLLLHDDFSTCLDSAKWKRMTAQWGGEDVNGGVHEDNVQCAADGSRAKNILQLRAHGDLFPGSTPLGKKRVYDADDAASLVDRTMDDRYLEWALDGVSPTPCNQLERCAARRVGAAIQTASVQQNAGVLIVRLKPCDRFGTLTQVGWGDTTSREDETMQQVPFLPLWKAGMYQAKTTPEVAFVQTSPSLVPVADAGVADNDGFIQVAMQWNATLGRTNLYVNGQLVHKQVLDPGSRYISAEAESLVIGVWFPNAVAGEPLFESCKVSVDEVHVFKAEITGERWCDFEDVDHDAISCASDSDCTDWVTDNCFMPIHEAVCVEHRVETLKLQPTQPNADSDTEDEESETERELDTSEDVQPQPQYFCQFRLQPTTTTQSDATQSLRSSTEMNQRVADLRWHTEEDHNTDLSRENETDDDTTEPLDV